MRNLGLDLLRLVAVLLVLGRHLFLAANSSAILSVWKTGGWVGVDIFFVLSGFLVSSLIFNEYRNNNSIDIKRFLIRRGLKIYPAFYALIIFSIIVMVAKGDVISRGGLVGELFFVQNYLGGIWNHTWSLAVEEHFYFGIAAVTWFLVSRKKDNAPPFSCIPLIFITIAVFCLTMRVANLLIRETYTNSKFLYGTHLRADSLMFGVFLAYLWCFKDLKSRIQRIPGILLCVGAIILLSPAFIFQVEKYQLVSVFGVMSFYMGGGLLVLWATRLEQSRYWIWNVLGNLGAASYSIYLWHMPVAEWGWPILKKLMGIETYVGYCISYIIGSLVFGLLMSKVIEWPVLKIRDRLYPKPKRSS